MSGISVAKPNKASALASLRALIAGTQKHTSNGQMTFGNATYTAASLVQTLQSLLDAMASYDAAVAQAKDNLAALRGLAAKVNPVVRAYRRYLVATYGNAVETLADYGLKPPKARATSTSEQKATTAAKALATRQARGTTSKKQKASIKGTTVTRTVTSAVPAANAATAPATPVASSKPTP